MTTKPKARKFRIPRSMAANALASGPAPGGDAAPAGQTRAPQTESGQPPNTIDAIRQEGLTGRQLRIARRIAEKNGLLPVSDYDAVRQLRDSNIDPFSRESIIDLIRGKQKRTRQDQGSGTAPGTALAPAEHRLPQPLQDTPQSQESIAYRRNREIQKIQLEIARRRRRKLLLNRAELDRLVGAVERRGYTLVPLELYWKQGRAKLRIGLAKGKKEHDKRATEKDRDWQRERSRLMKSSRR